MQIPSKSKLIKENFERAPRTLAAAKFQRDIINLLTFYCNQAKLEFKTKNLLNHLLLSQILQTKDWVARAELLSRNKYSHFAIKA